MHLEFQDNLVEAYRRKMHEILNELLALVLANSKTNQKTVSSELKVHLISYPLKSLDT